MNRCTGMTTRNCVRMISRAMEDGEVVITDHYYPSRKGYLENLSRNVIPKIYELLSGMGLEGFKVTKNIKGDYVLKFTNPIKGVGSLYEHR